MKKLFLVIAVVIVLVGCGKKTDYTKDYQNLEAKFLSAGKAFVKNNTQLIPTDNKEKYSIRLEQLYNGNYLKNKLVDPQSNKECDKQNSFIHVQQSNNQFTYTTHLVCDNYTTK